MGSLPRFPEAIDLTHRGAPFEKLEQAYDYAVRMTHVDGYVRRIIWRQAAGNHAGAYPWRRWVVLPTGKHVTAQSYRLARRRG